MSKRPNILVIITDEQHANAMSNTGNADLHTPGMDAIAAAGVRFDRAYCTYPVCTPSRASMFTGKMPSEVGIGNGSGGHGLPEQGRRQEMGWVFRDAGYETAYAGKWHLPGQHMEEGHGFEILSPMNDELATCKSIEFLRRTHEKPFLLVTSLWQPHGCCPYHRYPDPRTCAKLGLDKYGLSSKGPDDDSYDWPDDAYEQSFLDRCPRLPDNFEPSRYEPDVITKKRDHVYTVTKRPPFWQPDEEWNAARNWGTQEHRFYRWAYYRLVERLDGQIQRILGALSESGHDQNTLVVFTSDHGDMLSSHRLTAKDCFYEESVRIPLLMRLPGQIPAGTVVNDALVSNGLDLIPTLCDFAGITPPQGLRGMSLRPLTHGVKPRAWRDDLLIELSKGMGLGRMIHTGRYKYARYNTGDHREELYDLELDPGEMRNLAEDAQYQELKSELREKLDWRLQELVALDSAA
ncbi:MAG: sulfatase-like hydrolase/transferase [Chitinivibrionales bacterium]|nr:sulfatase-like hydrolase/transferase [Chitinivibrionales bacterium]